MSENIQTQFKVEGQPAFEENTENDNSADSSADQTDVDQTGASDQDKKETDKKDGDKDKDNFADHPRWKEREDDWKNRFNEQEERHTSELSKLREEFDEKYGSKAKAKDSETGADLPPWFGGDEDQWKEFLKWNEGLVSKVKQDTLKEFQSKSESEQKAIEDATNYFNEQVKAIETDKESNPDGTKVDRNKLLKFVLDNELVDTKGRWNYRAGFLMMKAQVTSKKSDVIKEKKDLASATTSENRAETKPPAYKTSADFQKPGERPW